MKYIVLLFLLISSTLNAQNVLKFDKRNVECEDKWIAYQMDKDSLYTFGFIYIDAQAGLTFDYEGEFRIANDGTFIPSRKIEPGLKSRLEPNRNAIAVIPEEKFKELHIDKVPAWLKLYKGDENSIERLFRWGYIYNGYNECAKGLTYLERAQKINPKFEGLAVELAFSYNCLGQYDKAITVLNTAIESNPTNAYLFKELIYAQLKSGNLALAAETCKKAISVCTDKTYHSENCYNLLHEYYLKKDRLNFNAWLTEAKKWPTSNEIIKRNIKLMEDELAR